MKIGDKVCYGVDLGEIVAEEIKLMGEVIFRVRFSQDPDDKPPTEGLYKESELRSAEAA